MSLLSKIKNDKKVKIEEDRDTLGGGGLFDSDAYSMVIEAFFLGQSEKGSISATIHAKADDGRVYRETLWVTNQKQETFYTKDDTNYPLMGYSIANAISMLTTGTGILEFEDDDVDTKVIKLWNGKERKEVNTEVEMLTPIIGERITLGIVKEIVDKTEKGDDGKYHPTGETREQNSIAKVFHDEYRVTLTEAKAEQEEGEFIDKWLDKNKGKTIDKSKGTGEGGKPGSPKSDSSESKPKRSLFANKNKSQDA